MFLLGAAPGVADLAARRLIDRYRDLNVVGSYSPNFDRPNEDQRVVEMINQRSPDFLFVALGTPSQEIWISQHLDQLRVRVAVGVGCVFDVLAGSVSRAPTWMQLAGLEWSYRLVQEPGRLWRRYLLDDLPAFARLLASSFHPTTIVVGSSDGPVALATLDSKSTQ
jgi:N-acetylglucosaminyldiphosphoundecaprenol N-acetyl-beta-D-mannosaminyltransferase